MVSRRGWLQTWRIWLGEMSVFARGQLANERDRDVEREGKETKLGGGQVGGNKGFFDL